jgi:lysozyme family protein
MAVFDVSFAWMMANEDPSFAYKTVPDDPPGAHAISGINSHAFLAQFEAISAIPQAQRGPAVQSFYQVNFWNRWLAQITSDGVVKRVFDEAVNGGAGTAVRILQAAVNTLTNYRIGVDGNWGPMTVASANACDQLSLTGEFIQLRCAHYRSIAASNPSEAKYLPEWLARAQK